MSEAKTFIELVHEEDLEFGRFRISEIREVEAERDRLAAEVERLSYERADLKMKGELLCFELEKRDASIGKLEDLLAAYVGSGDPTAAFNALYAEAVAIAARRREGK